MSICENDKKFLDANKGGHRGPVESIAVYKDKIISGSWDETIRIWDINSGKLEKTLEGHKDTVTSIAVYKDKIISGSEDSTIKIWDFKSGKLEKTLKGHSDRVTSIAVYEDKIISGLADGKIKIWNIKSGKLEKTLKGHSDRVSSIAVYKNKIISGSWDETIKIWDIKSGKLEKTLEGHLDTVSSIAVYKDKIISGSWDETIKIWDIKSGKLEKTFKGHENWVTSIAAYKDKIISGLADGKIKIWDINSGKEKTLEGHSGRVTSIAVYKDKIISGSWDETIKIWDINSGKEKTLEGHSGRVTSIAVYKDKIISGSWDETIKIWDIKSGKLEKTLEGHNGRVTSIAVYKDKIISGSWDETIKIWDINSGKEKTLEGHSGRVTSIAVYKDKIISGSWDETIKIWDIKSGKLEKTLEGHNGRVTSIAVYEDKIISGSEDNTIKIWDIKSGKLEKTLEGHNGRVTSIAVYEDKIISGSEDNTIKIWDINSGDEISEIKLGVNKFYIEENYLIGLDVCKIIVFDISNLFEPKKIGGFETLSRISAFSGYVKGKIYIFYATYSGDFGCEAIRKIKKDIKESILKLGVKSVIIGDSGVGKTTFGNCIEYNEFDDTIPSTHAMHFFKKICNDIYNIKIDEKNEIKGKVYFEIWDFAGQPTYHISHKQNFDKTRIIFFVIDMSRDLHEKNSINYWINSIKEHLDEMIKEQIQVFIIATKSTNKIKDLEKLKKVISKLKENLSLKDDRIKIVFFEKEGNQCKFFDEELKKINFECENEIIKSYIEKVFKVRREKGSYDKVNEIIDEILNLREKHFCIEKNELLNKLNKKDSNNSEDKYDMYDLNIALEIMKEDNSIEVLKIKEKDKDKDKEYIILKPYWRHIFVNSILEFASKNKIVCGAISIEDLINLNFEVKFDKPLKKELEKIEKEEKEDDRKIFKNIFKDELKKSEELKKELKKLKIEFIKEIIKRLLKDKIAYLKDRMLIFPSRFNYKPDKFNKKGYFEIQNLNLVAHNNIDMTIGKIVVSLYYSGVFEIVKHLDKGVKLRYKNKEFLIEFEWKKIYDTVNPSQISIHLYAKENDKKAIDMLVAYIKLILRENLSMLYENRKYKIVNLDETIGFMNVSVLDREFFNCIENIDENKCKKYSIEKEKEFEIDKRVLNGINDLIDGDWEKINSYIDKYNKKEKISILHLSDLHVSKDFNVTNEVESLIDALQKSGKINDISHIVISGDITKRSEIDEFETAYKFISWLMDRLNLDAQKVIVVPGNHDYSRRLAQEAYDVVSKSSGNIRKDIDVDLNDKYYLKRDIDRWDKRFEIFSEYFYEKLYNQSFDSNDIRLIAYSDNDLGFVLINTSAKIDHFFPTNVDIDVDLFQERMNKIKNRYKKIFVVGHHPVYSEQFYDFQTAMSDFKVLAYLHGHLHRNYLMKFTNYTATEKEMLFIGAGILSNPDKRAMVPGVPLRFNIVEVNENNKINLKVYTYERQNNNTPWSYAYIYHTDKTKKSFDCEIKEIR